MAAFLACLVLFLASAPFHQHSEAAPGVDVSSVLIAYNQAFNSCKDITDLSPSASKKAADAACYQAFQALDGLKLNTCHGWRNAGCRLVYGQNYYQCSCLVSYCDDEPIDIQVVKPFYECATKVWSLVVGPTPTLDLQQDIRNQDASLHTTRKRRYSDLQSGATSFMGAHAHATTGAGSSSGYRFRDTAAYQTLSMGPFLSNAPKPFPCKFCPRSYISAANLNEHLKSHTTENTKCPVCSGVFATKGNLKSHIQNCHPGTPLPEQAVRGKRPRIRENENEIYECSICPRTYTSISGLRDHEKSHTTLDTHCFQCKMTLGSRVSYRIHMRSYHPKDALEEEAGETARREEATPVPCDQCDKRFKDAEGLKRHKKYHDGKTQCKECGLVCSGQSVLYRHKKQAHSKKKDDNLPQVIQKE